MHILKYFETKPKCISYKYSCELEKFVLQNLSHTKIERKFENE